MYQNKITIRNKTGLHARPASELVEFCSQFESEILLTTEEGEEINAKSIISILSGEVYQGTKLTLLVEGPDETTAGTKVAHFLDHLPD